jgi:hypothetical protein
VVDVRGVAVDVCGKCRGVALDAGELQQLQHEAEVARAHKHENATLDLHPKVKLGVVPACTKCRRKTRPEHGFVWDERLYCGSCAPEGSVPYTDELTRAHPSEEPSLTGTYGGVMGDAAGGPRQSALSWLLSKLIS